MKLTSGYFGVGIVSSWLKRLIGTDSWCSDLSIINHKNVKYPFILSYKKIWKYYFTDVGGIILTQEQNFKIEFWIKFSVVFILFDFDILSSYWNFYSTCKTQILCSVTDFPGDAAEVLLFIHAAFRALPCDLILIFQFFPS